MRILDLFRAGSSTQSIVVWPPWTSNYQIRRPPTLRWPRTRPNTHKVGGDADSRNCTRGVEDSTSQLGQTQKNSVWDCRDKRAGRFDCTGGVLLFGLRLPFVSLSATNPSP